MRSTRFVKPTREIQSSVVAEKGMVEKILLSRAEGLVRVALAISACEIAVSGRIPFLFGGER